MSQTVENGIFSITEKSFENSVMDPDEGDFLNQFSLSTDTSLVKFLWSSDQWFLRDVANRQTDRQTNKRRYNIASLTEVITQLFKGYPSALAATTGAVLGRQNTSPNNLPPNMAASDFLQWNATLLSCSNSRVEYSSRSFDNIKHTERSPITISLFYYDTTYSLCTYNHRPSINTV